MQTMLLPAALLPLLLFLAPWQAASFSASSSAPSSSAPAAPAAAATAEYRTYCSTCSRPASNCLCPFLPETGPVPLSFRAPSSGTESSSSSSSGAVPTMIPIRVHILQHPREYRKRKATSTVPLIRLCVGNTTVTPVSDGSAIDSIVRDSLKLLSTPTILLYPSDQAVVLVQEEKDYDPAADDIGVRRHESIDGQSLWDSLSTVHSAGTMEEGARLNIVLLDGTWSQTQAMFQSSQILQGLRQVMLPVARSEERIRVLDVIRKEPADHCTSTLEALAEVLRCFIPPHRGRPSSSSPPRHISDVMENVLKAMVGQQLKYANSAQRKSPRYYRSSSLLQRQKDQQSSAGPNDLQQSKQEKRQRRRRPIGKRRSKQLSLVAGTVATVSDERWQTKDDDLTHNAQLEKEFGPVRYIYVAHLG